MPDVSYRIFVQDPLFRTGPPPERAPHPDTVRFGAFSVHLTAFS